MTENSSLLPLRDFLNQLLIGVSQGSTSAHEAAVAANQYPYLREVFLQQADSLTEALLTGDEAYASAVTAILNTALTTITQQLISFRGQLPDMPTTPAEIGEIGQLRRRACQAIGSSLEERRRQYESRRQAFVHELVARFSRVAPGWNAGQENRLASLVEQSLRDAGKNPVEAQAMSTLQSQLVSLLEPHQGAQGPFVTIVDTALKTEVGQYVRAAWRLARLERAAYNVLVRNPDLRRPDVVADMFTHGNPEAEPVEHILLRALKLARAAQGLREPAPTARSRAQPFFSVLGGPAAVAADRLLRLASEPLRELLVKEKISRAVSAIFTKTEALTGRLGEDFVQSTVFQQALHNLTRSLAEPPRAQGMRGVRGLFDDVIVAILRGPLDSVTTRAAGERVLQYFELVRANAILGVAPPPGAVSRLTVAPWELVYLLSVPPGIPKAESRRPSLTPWYLPFFGIPAGIGRGVGNVAASFLDRTISALFGGAFFGHRLSLARRAAAVPTPLGQDLPKLIALVVVITLVVLFVLPTPLNVPYLIRTSRTSSLVASLSQGEKFHDDSREFPVPDFGPIKQSPHGCLEYGRGTTAPNGRQSYQFSTSQQDRTDAALKTYPQIGLYSCLLGCPANKINFTAFNFTSPGGNWAWAPAAQPGNIFFYAGAFNESSVRSLARLVAHELAHQIQYFKINIYNSYLRKGYCGLLGTYRGIEWPSETFAEAAAMYMIGDPLLEQKCEKGFTFMQQLFSQCR